MNIKTRISNLTPSAAVIVVSIRAVKMHGGGPPGLFATLNYCD